MKKNKRIGKHSSKEYKIQKEIIEIFSGLYEMPDGSILNSDCDPQAPYKRKYDPLQLLRNFMNQMN
jgi:hypothetical protein